MRLTALSITAAFICVSGAPAMAGVHDYEVFAEGFLGETFYHDGVTYRDANRVSGFYPDGAAFDEDDNGNQFIIEDATAFYNDFAGYGSPDKSLTFGSAFVPGDNLSIGALASVWLTFDQAADAASFDLAYYENGPWGGIDWVVEAVLDGQVVATETLTIADGGGRDNATWATLSIDGAVFDELHIYSWLDGDYTAARGMIDDLTFNTVPAPAGLALLIGAAATGRRRRR
jgi:hypothetical protein